MATATYTRSRTAEFFRLLDTKDEAGLRAAWAADAQAVDEISRGWLRGRKALDAYMHANLPRLSGIHSTIGEADVRQLGDLEVETFMLRQSYVMDGTKVTVEAPTTMIWRREGDTWKVALMHSVPLTTTP